MRIIDKRTKEMSLFSQQRTKNKTAQHKKQQQRKKEHAYIVNDKKMMHSNSALLLNLQLRTCATSLLRVMDFSVLAHLMHGARCCFVLLCALSYFRFTLLLSSVSFTYLLRFMPRGSFYLCSNFSLSLSSAHSLSFSSRNVFFFSLHRSFAI